MNDLQVFTNPEFGEIRTVELNGEPWFVGKDVAKALGYKDTINALKSHVDAEDKKRGWQITTPSGAQEMTIINESGLYSLILSSKLPGAKRFKRWVTAEVLPAIRKTGAYATPEAIQKAVTSPETISCLVAVLKDVMPAQAPAVVYSKAQPEVSLIGLARAITATRRVMLDMGSTPDEIGTVTRSIINTCGFRVPKFKKPPILDLFDYL